MRRNLVNGLFADLLQVVRFLGVYSLVAANIVTTCCQACCELILLKSYEIFMCAPVASFVLEENATTMEHANRFVRLRVKNHAFAQTTRMLATSVVKTQGMEPVLCFVILHRKGYP